MPFENSSRLNSQAIELASQGQFKEAIACLKKALTIEKFNYLLWYNLGVTYRDAGQLEAAKNALEQAYSLNDEDDETIETLALVCFHLGNSQEAIKYCYEGIRLNESNANIWNTLGVIFFNMQSYDFAVEAFEHAITINPYYYDALYNLRDTYKELGNKAGWEMCINQMKLINSRGRA